MKIYFIRHGESEANIAKMYNSRDENIHGLTNNGREQIKRSAHEISNVKFDGFFASNLLRARESADIISEKIGKKYEVYHDIREIDMGFIEGTSGFSADRAYREVLCKWLSEGDVDARVEGGESCKEIRERFQTFIKKIKEKYGDKLETIVVVSHAGFIRSVVPAITENLPDGYTFKNRILNGGIAVVDLDEKICIKWNGMKVQESDKNENGVYSEK